MGCQKIEFKKVSRFQEDESITIPVRKTKKSAGYDLAVAEDTIIWPYDINSFKILQMAGPAGATQPIALSELADLTKQAAARPTLVSTGLKCYLPDNCYLELSVRSSTPLKYWLVLANGVGVIDGDYVDNPDNEGEIFLQLINLSPLPIQLKKGDVIGQGIVKPYCFNDDEEITAERKGGFGSTNV